MRIHYLEIVTNEVDAVCAAYAAAHVVQFGTPDPGLGNARTAVMPGGGLVGVRAPLRETEAPVVRPYWLVDDIEAAVAAAVAAGGEIAHPPLEIPGHGTFAIYVQGGIDHGFWQLRPGAGTRGRERDRRIEQTVLRPVAGPLVVNAYVILMRGINVGGKNKIPMAELKLRLEELGFEGVATYIQSGNVVLRSDLDAASLSAKIEDMLPRKFKLDSSTVRVVALEYGTFKKIITQAPEGFGEDTSSYRYNVIFFMDASPIEAMPQIDAREGVDTVWQGDHAIYFRNSVPNASKSRLSRITQQPIYRSITIRNWNTTTKLAELLEGASGGMP